MAINTPSNYIKILYEIQIEQGFYFPIEATSVEYAVIYGIKEFCRSLHQQFSEIHFIPTTKYDFYNLEIYCPTTNQTEYYFSMNLWFGYIVDVNWYVNYLKKPITLCAFNKDITYQEIKSFLFGETNIRMACVTKGMFLDEFLTDNQATIRAEVAKHGYGLSVLVTDNSDMVRLEVAKQGFGLNVLVADKSARVRLEVAKQGYGLAVLAFDKSPDVSKLALQKIKERSAQKN